MFPILTGLFLTSLLACASNPKAEEPVKPAKKISKPAVAEKKMDATKKVESAKKKEIKLDEDLEAIEKRYAAAKTVSMNVKKSMILSLLERTDVSDGKFYLSGEKIRLELEQPAKSVAVVNGNEFWLIEYPPAGTDEKVRVTKSSLGAKSQSQVLVTALLGRGHIQEQFKVQSKQKKDGNLIYKLKPLSDISEVKDLEVTVDNDKKTIVGVNYLDEIDNKTKFEFSKIEFDGDVPEKLFTYSPPKDAEISHF